MEKLEKAKREQEEKDKIAIIDASMNNLEEPDDVKEQTQVKKEGEKKRTKQLRERHSRNATIGGQRSEQDTVKIEIEKLHKKELAPITKSPSKDLKSHQGPTSRHLS